MVAGQEDHDFPEFVTDDDDQPVTLERVVPLSVMPLGWMLTMTGVGAWKQVRELSVAGA